MQPIEQIKTGNVNVKTGEEEKGMRWVRATERLPKDGSKILIRKIDDHDNKALVDFVKSKFYHIAEKEFPFIEWLDESAPDQSSQIKLLQEQIRKQKEEIYRLRGKMEWISVAEQKPDLIEGTDCSKNVLAILNGELAVMNFNYNSYDGGELQGFFWANCYGNINGEGEWDDEYKPTYWQPLPEPPKKP